jgi:uncharacterized lipoprotein YajG
MKKLLSFGLLSAILLLSGCFEAEICRPVYTPTGRPGSGVLTGMPVSLKVNDDRTEKIFFKHMGFNYLDPGLEKSGQPVRLEKSPHIILKDSIEKALIRYGYVVKENAPVSMDINLIKFLYICDTGKQLFVFADIKFNVIVKNPQGTITQGLFSKRARKDFDAFRQHQDAETVLSDCLSTVVEEFVSDQAISDAVRKGYAM